MTWEKNVRRVVPYVAGEQPNKTGMVKLNTNECPYPPAPGVKAILQELDREALRLYPDTDAVGLVEALADHYGLEPEQIFVGVGSDDVLAMSYLTFFHSGRPILFPDVTYSFYDVWAKLFGIPYKTCALDENWHIRPKDYVGSNGGVIFPNPNAPTGLAESLDTVEQIVGANRDVVVIVDEAYVDFGAESALPLLKKYDNLLVVQTFSKSRAMAGVRIGFAVGSKKLIRFLKDVKFSFNSYTMNYPAQKLGVEAVKDDAYFRSITQKVMDTRTRAKEEFRRLGFSFPDSMANFLFVTHERIPAAELFTALRKENIYVRHWDKPRIDNYLRITIGTDGEMDKLFTFLKKYLESN